MSDTPPNPSTPPADSPRRAPWRRWWRTALPYILTAALAVAASVALQATVLAPAPPTSVAPTPATPAPAPPTPTLGSPTSAPEGAPPASAAPATAPDIVRQELLDLRAEDDRLWAAIYLARAISQVSDAEAQMRANNLDNVAQSLVAVDGSLELAYELADESVKNPIEQLRQRTSSIHDDLHVRPEGMDGRLAELRQTILTLIGERR